MTTRSRLLALALALPAFGASAEFAIAISPPRYELEAKAGELVRQTMEITNASAQPAALTVKTADWTYEQDGGVTFHDELAPGSCRPWVTIERRQLTVVAGRPYRYRFEVAPPAGTAPMECRFAILLEGQQESANAGGLMVPFNARLAVIVYLGIGGVQPELSVVGTSVQTVEGRQTPVLQVRNTGLAHGRLEGFLSGTDARNTPLDFVARGYPILPGETRAIPLNAARQGDPDAPVTLTFPVTVKGKLEWGKKQSQDFEQRFAQ
jgi:P pilus assembly chaperone PapD